MNEPSQSGGFFDGLKFKDFVVAISILGAGAAFYFGGIVQTAADVATLKTKVEDDRATLSHFMDAQERAWRDVGDRVTRVDDKIGSVKDILTGVKDGRGK